MHLAMGNITLSKFHEPGTYSVFPVKRKALKRKKEKITPLPLTYTTKMQYLDDGQLTTAQENGWIFFYNLFQPVKTILSASTRPATFLLLTSIAHIRLPHFN